MNIRQYVERPALALAIVLTAGAIIRLLVGLATSAIWWPDSGPFYLSAQSILEAGTYRHDAFKTPLYSAFLAMFIAGGETRTMGAVFIGVQHLLGLLTTAIYYRVAVRLFDPYVAFFSSLLFAIHALLLFYEASVLSEILCAFLLSVLVLQSLRMLTSPSVWNAAAAGLLAALVTLTRPVGTWFPVVIIGVLVIAHSIPGSPPPRTVRAVGTPGWGSRRALAAALIVGAVYGATLLPWMAHNRQTLGFWGVAQGTGFGLFARVFVIDDLPPIRATKYPHVRDLLAEVRARNLNGPYAVRRLLASRYRYAGYMADRAMLGFALETALAHPGAYVWNTLRQWRHQLTIDGEDWQICEAPDGPFLCSGRVAGQPSAMFSNRPPRGRSTLKETVTTYVRLAYIRMPPVIVFALLGFVWQLVTRPDNRVGVALLTMTVLYFSVVPSLLQWIEERYRLLVDPLVFMFAIAGVQAVIVAPRRLSTGPQASSPPSLRPPSLQPLRTNLTNHRLSRRWSFATASTRNEYS